MPKTTQDAFHAWLLRMTPWAGAACLGILVVCVIVGVLLSAPSRKERE